MEGITIDGLTIAPRKRDSRLDDALVADLTAKLQTADVGTTVLSGLTRDTKTAAGSDGYAYRNALKDRGIPVVSVTRDVDTIRAAILQAWDLRNPAPDALDVPDDATPTEVKALRDAHKEATKDHADARKAAVPDAYRNAPGGAFTWALVRAAVKEDAPATDAQ